MSAAGAQPRSGRAQESISAEREDRVVQQGRSKAYRPLPEAERRAAFTAAVDAFERGDFFEAHELLEPAWMGTRDLVERELHQGLIKLAAAYVHAVRGNPAGLAKNLAGARARLAVACAQPAEAERVIGMLRGDPNGTLDTGADLTRSGYPELAHLLDEIDRRDATLAAVGARPGTALLDALSPPSLAAFRPSVGGAYPDPNPRASTEPR